MTLPLASSSVHSSCITTASEARPSVAVEMPAQALAQVCEVTWQLRGQAGPRQVEDPSVAVAANAGAGSHHWEMALFGRA